LDGNDVTISWNADDPDDQLLFFNIQYSPDNGATWEMIEQNLVVEPDPAGVRTFQLDSANLVRGEQALFRVWASDGIHTARDESDAPASKTNRPPSVRIEKPEEGGRIVIGQTLTLDGQVTDDDSAGTLPEENLVWSMDGMEIATGSQASVATGDLTEGLHTIRLQATDGETTESAEVAIEAIAFRKCRCDADCEVEDALIVAPSLVSWYPERDERTTQFSVRNRRPCPIDWQANASESWVQLGETSGETPATIMATFLGSNLEPGRHTAEVVITTSTKPEQRVSIPIEVRMPSCVGDCDGSDTVTIDELVLMINVALGLERVETCVPGDLDGDGAIRIDEIIQAVGDSSDQCSG
jgi:hypothetical protein